MDEVFEQTLGSTPLSEAALFKEVSRGLVTYRRVRDSSWQGEEARGGPKLEIEQATTNEEQPEIKRTPIPSLTYWDAVSAQVGGGKKGASLVRAMQRWLVQYVEKLPLDEIEMMAAAR